MKRCPNIKNTKINDFRFTDLSWIDDGLEGKQKWVGVGVELIISEREGLLTDVHPSQPKPKPYHVRPTLDKILQNDTAE